MNLQPCQTCTYYSPTQEGRSYTLLPEWSYTLPLKGTTLFLWWQHIYRESLTLCPPFRSSHQSARVSFLIKLQALSFSRPSSNFLKPATLLKKRLWHRCFPVNFAKFLRTPFVQSTSGWLLLVFILLRLGKTSKKQDCKLITLPLLLIV